MNHKSFNYTICLLQGNLKRTTKVIPLYLNDLEEIQDKFPDFLISGQNVGYKMPNQVKVLTQYLKGKDFEKTFSKEGKKSVERITNRLKNQAKRYCKEAHTECCKERCLQVIKVPHF